MAIITIPFERFQHRKRQAAIDDKRVVNIDDYRGVVFLPRRRLDPEPGRFYRVYPWTMDPFPA